MGALLARPAAGQTVAPSFPTGEFVQQAVAGDSTPAQLLGVVFGITADGRLLIEQGGQTVAQYGYEVAGDQFELWAMSPNDCFEPEPVIGVYRWWREGGAIRLNAMDDPCPGRSAIANAVRWVPAPQ